MNKNKIILEWHSLFKDIVKNIWVIILCALIGFFGAKTSKLILYVPEYTSSATLIVNTGNGYSGYSASTEIAEIYTNVFTDSSMKQKAAEYLGKESFSGSVSAKTKENTNFLDVSVTAKSPMEAYEELKAVLEVYPEISSNIFSNASVTVLKAPSIPQAPSNSFSYEPKKIAVLTAFLGACVVLFLSVTRDTVKNEKIFDERIEAGLLGKIPHEKKPLTLGERLKKKKKALLIYNNAFASLRFVESYHKVAAKLEYMKHKNGDRVFAITSVAENEGKSTAASNIAISLAERGNRVVLFDLDTKKPALYKVFEKRYNKNFELGELLCGNLRFSEYKFRRYKKTSLYLAINTHPYPECREGLEDGTLTRLINSVKNNADFIIIDTAPVTMDSAVTDIVKNVDKVLLVVRSDTAPIAAVNDAVTVIENVGGSVAGCLLNDVYPDFSPFGLRGFDEGGSYYGKGYGRYGHYGRYGKYSAYDKKDLALSEHNESKNTGELKSMSEVEADE